jgi:hypothetical protein
MVEVVAMAMAEDEDEASDRHPNRWISGQQLASPSPVR